MYRRRSMQMNVHECPQCGSYLRYGGDPHACGTRDDSHIRFNLPTTEEEKAVLSETVRKVWNIPEEFWYRNRPHYREIIRRLRAAGDPRVGSDGRLAEEPAQG